MIYEELLHFIWRTKLLAAERLETIDGETIEIIHPGIINLNQGPDFTMAKLKIAGIIWVGQVEMHVMASDWKRHSHDGDKQYDNVILHVVWQYDQEILIHNQILKTLELKNYIREETLNRYRYLQNTHTQIPCQALISNIPQHVIQNQLARTLIERFHKKIERIKTELEYVSGDWNEVFYKNIAKYLVTPVNAIAMDWLTTIVKLKLLQKYNGKLISLESLLFGTAGFLQENYTDSYYQSLKFEYQYLKNKHSLDELSPHVWKFLRMRPAHFPSMRIAQIAGLFYSKQNIFDQLIHCDNINRALECLDSNPTDYWKHHFRFGEEYKMFSEEKNAGIGIKTKEILLINVVCPMLFCYGNLNAKNELREKALHWMGQLKAEINQFTKIWTQIDIKFKNAAETQGCLELYHAYCKEKKCLDCQIGAKLMTTH
ncbi:MAG: DUF2851 family protein [Bacteroidota bacterium]|nr:DUF2851 family protein [Bacteroidota bacterium]